MRPCSQGGCDQMLAGKRPHDGRQPKAETKNIGGQSQQDDGEA